MSRTLAAILGGAAGAVALVGLMIIIICYFVFRGRNMSRTSETGSSNPSLQVGGASGIGFTMRDATRFAMDELSSATRNFSDKSLIGQGKFGEVYKGLLHDGLLVAMKKRPGPPSQEFVDEVRYLSSIQHRNLVSLLGYCQENDLQILVYEYIPNGSVSFHLYGAGQGSQEKLEFKHRLSIALGAAKGLAHLHSLSPRLIHKDFKTANVLVDENFIAKVADAGLRNFLGRFDNTGPSSQVAADEIFLAPEVTEFRRFSDKSDVYSFGVFLLELVTGQEARDLPSCDVGQNLVDWFHMLAWADVKFDQESKDKMDSQKKINCRDGKQISKINWTLQVQNFQESDSISTTICDKRLGNSFTTEGMEELIQLIGQCMDSSSERRPPMTAVVTELDRILEKEMSLTTIMGEGTPVVTLGSQLFRASK
ncbi:hypothetical protein OROMI_027669 [Orobanche minor]